MAAPPTEPMFDSEDNASRLVNAAMFMLLGVAGLVIGLWRLAARGPGLIASLGHADYAAAKGLGLSALIGAVIFGLGLLFGKLGYGQFRNAMAVRRAARALPPS